MKVVEGAKVYQCEHCNKKSHHPSSLSRHERFCPKKPENQHQCFKWCKHLVKENTPYGKDFYCSALKQRMFSYKAEKSDIYHNGEMNEHIRMPLTCESYEDIDPNWDMHHIADR